MTLRRELRRWCPILETHQDADDPVCAWSDHTHRLRIRRMYVCEECEAGFFDRTEAERHACDDGAEGGL